MNIFHQMLKEIYHDQSGATSAEYALLLALIAIAIIISVTFFGQELRDSFTESGNELRNALEGNTGTGSGSSSSSTGG